jgi:hypothetical protein
MERQRLFIVKAVRLSTGERFDINVGYANDENDALDLAAREGVGVLEAIPMNDGHRETAPFKVKRMTPKQRDAWLARASDPMQDPKVQNGDPTAINAAMLRELQALRAQQQAVIDEKKRRQGFSFGRVLMLLFCIVVLVPLATLFAGPIGFIVAVVLIIVAAFSS